VSSAGTVAVPLRHSAAPLIFRQLGEQGKLGSVGNGRLFSYVTDQDGSFASEGLDMTEKLSRFLTHIVFSCFFIAAFSYGSDADNARLKAFSAGVRLV
jgi:hypothetical protein